MDLLAELGELERTVTTVEYVTRYTTSFTILQCSSFLVYQLERVYRPKDVRVLLHVTVSILI